MILSSLVPQLGENAFKRARRATSTEVSLNEITSATRAQSTKHSSARRNQYPSLFRRLSKHTSSSMRVVVSTNATQVRTQASNPTRWQVRPTTQMHCRCDNDALCQLAVESSPLPPQTVLSVGHGGGAPSVHRCFDTDGPAPRFVARPLEYPTPMGKYRPREDRFRPRGALHPPSVASAREFFFRSELPPAARSAPIARPGWMLSFTRGTVPLVNERS